MNPALEVAAATATFDGHDGYIPQRDDGRLRGQALAVWRILADCNWHTIPELSSATGGSEAGVSARIRDLRKPRFGGHSIEREHVANGLHRYRLRPVDLDAIKAAGLNSAAHSASMLAAHHQADSEGGEV